MKKVSLLLSALLLLAFGAHSQQITWGFANPQLVNGDTEMQFDVELKCNQTGTYLRDMQVYFDYNPVAFGNNIDMNGNVTNTMIGIMNDPGVPGNPFMPLYGIVNMVDNTATRLAVITETLYPSKFGGEVFNFLGTDYPYNIEVPTDWVGFLQFNIVIADANELAGISFTEDLMSGGQYYTAPGSADPVPYVDPDIYYNDLLNFPLGPQPATVWTGAIDDDWFDAGNWTGGVPNEFLDAEIPNVTKAPQPVIISGSATVGALTISTGATLEIGALANLTCTGNFTDDGNMIIRSTAAGTGSFIDNGNVGGFGTEIVERYAPANEWHLVSPPISNAQSGMYTGQYLQTFDEGTETWTDIVPTTDPLFAGQGYALWSVGPDNIPYDGWVNAFPVSFNYTAGLNGWNLTGNPYPSAIDWDMVDKGGNLDGAIWKWDPILGDYVYYINGGGVANTTNNIVAVAQGFFVKANASGTIGFDAGDRLHDNTATFYKSDGGFVDNMLLAEVTGNDITTSASVRFVEGATEGHDSNYDVAKLVTTTAEVPSLYSITEEEIYAINTLGEFEGNEVVNLGFHAGVNGSYTITFSGIETFDATVMIEDLKLNQMIELSEGQTYTFDYTTTDDVHRFNLVFGPLGLGDEFVENVNIYSNNSSVYVNVPEVDGSIYIYNLLGQDVASETITDNTTVISLNQTGYYIVKVLSNEGVVTKKVFVE